MRNESISDKFKQGYKPKDATHYFEFEFYKYAKPPHDRKLLVWRCGGWRLSPRTYLERRYLIENALNDRQLINLQLPLIEEQLKTQPLEQIAEKFEIDLKKLETILNEAGILKTQNNENKLITIFG